MKKNTLLYLDETLVQDAKDLNLNLSELATNAIERAIRLQQAHQDADEILENAEQYYLPIQLEKLTINNLGPVQHLKADFKQANVLVGPNASGKTLIINKLHEALTRHGKSNYPGTIEIQGVITPGEGCVIFDDLLNKYDQEISTELIKRAKEKYGQVLFTSTKEFADINNIDLTKDLNTFRKKELLMDELEALHEEREQLEAKLAVLQEKVLEIDVR